MSGVDYLVVAISGRALAQSARRAGLAVHVIDLFGDTDTRAAAAAVTVVPADPAGGFDPVSLRAAVRALPADLPLVAGSGFEHVPELLDAICRGRSCLGNPPALLECMRRPSAFFALLDELAIPHPPVITDGTAPDANWLVKHIGGRGGAHIDRARPGADIPPGQYLQRYAEGISLSALILADGEAARVLGYTRHWRAQPGAGAPFRHSGMVALADSGTVSWQRQVAAIARALAQRYNLVGLCGLDFILAGGRRNGAEARTVQVLELNPRPPASFELHEATQNLFSAHVEACRGRLPTAPVVAGEALPASAVMYAAEDCTVPPAFKWPAWTADRPAPGSRVRQGVPVCTVFGAAAAPAAACRQVRARMRRLATALG